MGRWLHKKNAQPCSEDKIAKSLTERFLSGKEDSYKRKVETTLRFLFFVSGSCLFFTSTGLSSNGSDSLKVKFFILPFILKRYKNENLFNLIH